MLVRDSYTPDTRLCDEEVMQEAFSSEDAKCILRTTPAPSGVGDSLIWHYSRNGIYSVNAYHLAMNIISGQRVYDETRWKMLWHMKVPPRVKAFMWHLSKGT